MKRTTRVLLIGALTAQIGLVWPATASAQIIDPWGAAKVALLAKISKSLYEVYKFFYTINAKTKEIRDRIERMFPNDAMRQIESWFQQVRSIQDEITDLSCRWKFSPRILAFRQGLLKLGPFCRDQYQSVFGAPLMGPDADLEEFRQMMGTTRWNVVADTIAVSRQWNYAAAMLQSDARAAVNTGDPDDPHSIGYSQRLLAVEEALHLQVSARDNAQEAMRLAGVQEDLDAERREDWRQKNAALQMLVAVRGSRAGLARRSGLGASLTEALGR